MISGTHSGQQRKLPTPYVSRNVNYVRGLEALEKTCRRPGTSCESGKAYASRGSSRSHEPQSVRSGPTRFGVSRLRSIVCKDASALIIC